MVVEVGINSYVTELELIAYAADRGISLTGDITILIASSMDYIETLVYRGSKAIDTQLLQFPRDITSDLVPNNVKNAQMAACLLIAQGEDLQPTLGKKVLSEKIDVIEVTYSDNSSDAKVFTKINALLREYLASVGGLKLVRV